MHCECVITSMSVRDPSGDGTGRARLTMRLPRIIIPLMSFLFLRAMVMPMRELSRAVAVARLG